MTAAQNGHESVVRLLLDKGANVNATTASGYSPLMLAALNGFLHVVQVLVANSADANAVTTGDLTALDVAAQSGNTAVEQFLAKRTQARKAGQGRHLRLDVFEAAKRGDLKQMKYVVQACASWARVCAGVVYLTVQSAKANSVEALSVPFYTCAPSRHCTCGWVCDQSANVAVDGAVGGIGISSRWSGLM